MKKQSGHVFLSTKKKDQACQNMPVDDSDNKVNWQYKTNREAKGRFNGTL